MKMEKIYDAVIKSIKDRFLIEESNAFSRQLIDLAGSELIKKNLLRIQRIVDKEAQKICTWKTLLLLELKNQDKLKQALEWAALVKESLLDPETADLYLFICFERELAIGHCLRIESTEQFCRKYVQRPKESAEKLIERSFLNRLEESSQELIDIDPLNKALSSTGKDFQWFKKEERVKWKKIFLSSYTGGDLVDEIFSQNEEPI